MGMLSETERAIFGRSYAAEPDVLIAQLKTDEAIAEADTLLLTVPNQLGVDYNAHIIEASSSTSRPGSAGGDASVLELHVTFVASARDIRCASSLPHLLRGTQLPKIPGSQLTRDFALVAVGIFGRGQCPKNILMPFRNGTGQCSAGPCAAPIGRQEIPVSAAAFFVGDVYGRPRG